MALPRIDTPTYQTQLPSTGQKYNLDLFSERTKDYYDCSRE